MGVKDKRGNSIDITKVLKSRIEDNQVPKLKRPEEELNPVFMTETEVDWMGNEVLSPYLGYLSSLLTAQNV